jgi:transcription elongation factor GreA
MPKDANAKYRMSEERLEELRKELDYLQTVREAEVAELIKEARSFGDLSENSEYDEAKAEQAKLYTRMAELKDLVAKAVIVTDSDTSDTVGIGTVVTVRDLDDGTEEEYKMVGSQEADPLGGRISDDSPLGHALFGHSEGDQVSVEAPVGTLKFEIIRISK